MNFLLVIDFMGEGGGNKFVPFGLGDFLEKQLREQSSC